MNSYFKIASALLVFLLLATTLPAQTHTGDDQNNSSLSGGDSTCCDRPNVIKTNLAGPLSILYEARVSPRRSIQVSVNRISFGLLGDEDNYFGLTGAVKFYLSQRGSTRRRPLPAGFYVSPYLRYLYVRETRSGLFSDLDLAEIRYNLFGGGVTAGYQVIFRKGFTLEFFAGGGYFPLSSSKIEYTYSSTYTPEVHAGDYKIDPRFGICIGYAFP